MTNDISTPPHIRGRGRDSKNRMIWKAPAFGADGFETILHLFLLISIRARGQKHSRAMSKKEKRTRAFLARLLRG